MRAAPLALVLILGLGLARLLFRPASAQLSELSALLPPFLTFNFDQLVKAAADTCEALPLRVLFSRSYAPEISTIDVVEVSSEGRRAYRASHAHRRVRDRFASPPPATLIYLAGWWNSPYDESSNTITRALLQRYPLILILDTRASFRRGYVGSASRVKALSHAVFEMIENLSKSGLSLSSIHLLGFSLGAHVAGLTGKLVKKRMQRSLQRITGLDPAKPCFVNSPQYTLSIDDAEFVHVIHTSGVVGMEKPLGHLDVYVNGVSVKQPECEDMNISLECDHAQAWRLYAASVTDDRVLVGQKCDAWQDLEDNECHGRVAWVGVGADPRLRGQYLYTTKVVNKRSEKKLRVFHPLKVLLRLLS